VPDSEERLPRVLLVDDDPAFGRLVLWVLEGAAEVDVRERPEEVMARVHEGWPDMVVSDLNMPECTGIELFEKLQADPKGRAVPFVLLTGTPSFEEGEGPIAEATAAGIKHVVNKDLGLDGLRARLLELVTQPR
jgi:CheY-like chemotaxis protein